MIGIYYIYSKSQDKYYVGKSKDIHKRILKHKSDLRLNKHHSPYLQNTYNKYGIEDLEFEVIQLCTFEESSELEQLYITEYNSYKDGFNATTGGEWGAPGRRFSAETRARLSENMRGEKNPMWKHWGTMNPNCKITKEVASYIYFFTHSDRKDFPKCSRKHWLGKCGITVDIYKKIQSNKTWKPLSEEISLDDEEMFKKTCDFIKFILSQGDQ